MLRRSLCQLCHTPLAVVSSEAGAQKLADQLMQSKTPIGIDCEGARLGRYGPMSLIQISQLNGPVVLIDALKPNTVSALRPVFESDEILKVFHDCREDSAALYHQFEKIRLQRVFDTQVACLLKQSLAKLPLRQVGYADLIVTEPGSNTKTIMDHNPHNVIKEDSGQQRPDDNIKNQMKQDPFLWHQRPLTRELIGYAIHGVKYLLPLYSSFIAEVSEEDVLHVSDRWVEYAQLNLEVEDVKIGTPLLGTVAAITDRGIFFKLNLGKTGVACTPSAMKRILALSIQVGDTMELAVSGVAVNGVSIYVDKRDPDWEYFDFNRRPSRQKKKMGLNEYIHEPSMIENAGSIDPLLRRGLGEDIDSDSDGEIDHEPILAHKPFKREDF